MSSIEKLKDQVNEMLIKFPETRDCDKKLAGAVWITFYKDIVKINDRMDCPFIYLTDLQRLPRLDSISRIRRLIQNSEERLLPVRIETVKARRIDEDRWRTYIRTEGLKYV